MHKDYFVILYIKSIYKEDIKEIIVWKVIKKEIYLLIKELKCYGKITNTFNESYEITNTKSQMVAVRDKTYLNKYFTLSIKSILKELWKK